MEQPGNPVSVRSKSGRVSARREGAVYVATASNYLGRICQRVDRLLFSNFEYINFWSTATRTLEKIKKSGGETTTGKTRLVWIKRKPF